MKVIGLTGGIGSGKSTVAAFLKEFGAEIIDADKLGHETLRHGTPVWKDIVAAFGVSMIGTNGDIDRGKLAVLVFNSPEAVARLNSITHPRILTQVRQLLKDYEARGTAVVIVEAALLIETEADWRSIVNEIWVTVAPQEIKLARLKVRSNYSEEESLKRMRSQSSDKYRIQHAGKVIDTDLPLPELKKRVKELWDRITLT